MFLFFVMKHYDQKQVGEERVLLAYTSMLLELKQDNNLEAGADAEVMEGCCLLACSSWLTQPAFLQNPALSARE